MNPQITLLAIPTFLVALESLVVVGLVREIAREMGASLVSAAQVTSAFALAAAFAGVPLAGLTKAWPKRRLLVAGLLVQASVNLAVLWTSSLTVLLTLRAISGASASLIPPNAAAFAAELAPADRRSAALAWTTGGVVAAFLAGVPLATFVGEGLGWRMAFALCASIACIGAVTVHLGLPKSTPIPRSAPLRGMSMNHLFTLTLGTTVFGFAASFSVIGFSGPLIETNGPWPVGLVQMFLGLGAIGGLLASVPMARQDSDRALIIAVFAILISMFVYSLSFVDIGEFYLQFIQATALIILGVGLFGLSPPIQLSLIRAAPVHREIALAMNGVAVFVGQGLGAGLGGIAVAHLGMIGAPVAGCAFGALAMLSALCILTLEAQTRRNLRHELAPVRCPFVHGRRSKVQPREASTGNWPFVGLYRRSCRTIRNRSGGRAKHVGHTSGCCTTAAQMTPPPDQVLGSSSSSNEPALPR